MGISRVGGVTLLTSVQASSANWDEAQFELLNNGNLVATFTTFTGVPGNAAPTLHAIVLNQNGNALSVLQTVDAGTTADNIGSSQIASNSNGDIFIAWKFGLEDGGGPTNGDVLGRVYNTSGAPASGELNLPVDFSSGEFNVDVVAMSSGNFLVTWDDVTIIGEDLDAQIQGRIFNASGVAVGGEFVINQTAANLQLLPHTTTLTGGNILVGWLEGALVTVNGEPSPVMSSIEARLLNSAGAVTGADIVLATASAGFELQSEDGNFELVALANGGFAIAWAENNGAVSPTNTTFNIRMQMFNAAGVATGSAVTVRSISGIDTSQFADNISDLELFQRADGTVMVSWQERTTFNPQAHVAILDANGTFIQPPINLETVATDDGEIMSIELLPDGQIMALTQSFGQGGIINYSTVKFQFIPGLLIDGTPNDDPNLIGGTGDDTISGLGGNDVLQGLAGADILNGGGGADVLVGGAGNDTMDGGDGADTYVVEDAGDVTGETNADVVTGGYDVVIASVNHTMGANLEQLVVQGGATIGTGNESANYLYGGNSGPSLTLNGMGGDDVIYASLAGGNFLNGGAGVDTLLMYGGNNIANGGTGSDIYYTYTASDVISEVGGDGIDTVYSNHSLVVDVGIEQVILFGAATTLMSANLTDNNIFYGNSADGPVNMDGNGGADVLFGGIGADTLTGGSGVDLLFGNGGADVLNGGFDTDVYYLTSGTEIVSEFPGGGFDTAYSNAAGTTTLAAEVEQLILYGAATGGVGTNGADYLYGHIASNAVTLNGGNGNDYLLDSAFSGDVLIGGGDNAPMDSDILDLRTGGNDFIKYASALPKISGFDTVIGFDADAAGGQDLIDLTGRGFNAGSIGGAIVIAASGADTTVTIGTETIYLVDVASSAVDASDFVF